MTALTYAVMYGNTASVQSLVEKGAKIDATDGDGRTALMFAAKKGDTASVQYLVEKGAKIDATSRDGRTALMEAAEEGDTASVQYLVEKGAKIDATSSDGYSDGKTALEIAEVNSRHEVVKILTEYAEAGRKKQEPEEAVKAAAAAGVSQSSVPLEGEVPTYKTIRKYVTGFKAEKSC
eukprot:Hpha_TRINITY_DN16145_c1_g1::TRINITY_DN16145_c1_g1_i27::g.6580::m.6580